MAEQSKPVNGAAPPPLRPQNSGLAVWSLVLGILSLVCVGFLAGVPAVICGHVARSRIGKSAGAMSGEGLALAGLITGYVGTALSILVVPILLAIAIPNFVKARETAQKYACINNLRLIQSAKEQWAQDKQKKEGDVPTPQDLDQYLPNGFAGLHCHADGRYSINAIGKAPACSVAGHELEKTE